MSETSGDRERLFPLIEKKHGKPVSHWLQLLSHCDSDKYSDQIAVLREGHGFSQAHANALVMFHRGSPSSKRFATPNDYFASLPKAHSLLARSIFSQLHSDFPHLDLVIAWNQPILRLGKENVFGLSASTTHLTINPFSPRVLSELANELKGFEVLKHTIRIPLNWEFDSAVLAKLVSLRLQELTPNR